MEVRQGDMDHATLVRLEAFHLLREQVGGPRTGSRGATVVLDMGNAARMAYTTSSNKGSHCQGGGRICQPDQTSYVGYTSLRLDICGHRGFLQI